jgi:hypothetical protein
MFGADLHLPGLRNPGNPLGKGYRSFELCLRDAGHLVLMQQSYGK